jgi:mRNA-degrading endonuclease toxin of MazEF toxin-antitoxin module
MQLYIPKKGDFIAVTFDPQSGHEQRGQRPALVVRGLTRFSGRKKAAPLR